MSYYEYIQRLLTLRWDKVTLAQKGMLVIAHRRAIPWLREYFKSC